MQLFDSLNDDFHSINQCIRESQVSTYILLLNNTKYIFDDTCDL